MVTVICKESGIEFEAETRRTKIHPLVSALKAEGSKAGTYRQVDAALAQVRKAGGYTSIDQFMALVKAHMAGLQAEATAKYNAQAAIERERMAAEAVARAQREEQRALLASKGYTWTKVETDLDNPDAYAAGWGEANSYRWQLWSSDNRPVTVAQALAEIAATSTEPKAKLKTDK